ncbi:MAG: hypothetical protein AB1552_14315, partial [Nitrospirota bacterium]
TPVRGRRPCAPPVLSAPVDISFVYSWLHPLRLWSLQESRGGSEKWIEAGLGSIPDIFGDNTVLSEIYLGLLSQNRGKGSGLIDITEALNCFCEGILDQITGINNLEGLLRQHMLYDARVTGLEYCEHMEKQRAGIAELFAILSDLSEPITAIYLELSGNGLEPLLDKIQEGCDWGVLQNFVGEFDKSGNYVPGLAASRVLRDYLGEKIMNYGFEIGYGQSRPNGARNSKYTYHFIEIGFQPNPLTLDINAVPPEGGRLAGDYYDIDEFYYLIDSIKADLRYREGKNAMDYVMP